MANETNANADRTKPRRKTKPQPIPRTTQEALVTIDWAASPRPRVTVQRGQHLSDHNFPLTAEMHPHHRSVYTAHKEQNKWASLG